MATTLQTWTATHPGVEVDGSGKWLVFKPCLKKARRFESYFAAHRALLSRDFCRCDESHFIVELGELKAPLSRSFQRWVEQE
jgi:hypothetical protein